VKPGAGFPNQNADVFVKSTQFEPSDLPYSKLELRRVIGEAGKIVGGGLAQNIHHFSQGDNRCAFHAAWRPNFRSVAQLAVIPVQEEQTCPHDE
jgi:hypothetical protein